MPRSDPKPKFFASQDDFRRWLAKHHETATELIDGYHKASTGRPSMTWSESVDQALCYGQPGECPMGREPCTRRASRSRGRTSFSPLCPDRWHGEDDRYSRSSTET